MEFVSTKLVLIGVRVHLFPSRTQKLSSPSPTILCGRLHGKIGNANTKKPTCKCKSDFFVLGNRYFARPYNRKWWRVHVGADYISARKRPSIPAVLPPNVVNRKPGNSGGAARAGIKPPLRTRSKAWRRGGPVWPPGQASDSHRTFAEPRRAACLHAAMAGGWWLARRFRRMRPYGRGHCAAGIVLSCKIRAAPHNLARAFGQRFCLIRKL